jgi:hypothetical protein
MFARFLGRCRRAFTQGTDDAARFSNLCAVGMGAIYLLWVLPSLVRIRPEGLSPLVGADYAVILASADIATTYGFIDVYDLGTQLMVQERLHGVTRDPSSAPATSPAFYLPIFIAIFVPLLLVPPVPSFWIWTAFTVVAIVLALRTWNGSAGESQVSLVPSLLFSQPALATLILGQVDVLLLVCLSAFLWAGIRGADVHAGLWLSGLLLKPQTLVVILPGLVLARRWKCLAGFAAGGLFLLACSLALGGTSALAAEAELWVAAAFGGSGHRIITGPPVMANWRAFGAHIVNVIGAEATWTLVIVASAATFLAALWLWRARTSRSGPGLALTVMASYAAACSLSPHAHVSMSLPLAAPLLFLVRAGLVPFSILVIWCLVPMALVLRNVVIAMFDPPIGGPGIDNLGMLLVNLMLLAWAVRFHAKGGAVRRSRIRSD